MLKKLLKYDLKNILQYLSIFYILTILSSLLTRIFINIDNSFIFNIIGQICSIITIIMIVTIIINCLLHLWLRFKNNLYGDESYLTHTIPVKKSTIYLSKFLSSIISLFISTIIIGLTIFIAYYSKDNITYIKNFLLPYIDTCNTTIIILFISILFIYFLEMLNLLESGYTGIILGHKKNNNKILFTLIFSSISYISTQLFALLSLFIISLFNKDFMNLFITNSIVDTSIIKIIIFLAIIVYIITTTILYIINIKLLNKGVNVD